MLRPYTNEYRRYDRIRTNTGATDNKNKNDNDIKEKNSIRWGATSPPICIIQNKRRMENYLIFIFSVIILALYTIKVYKDTSKQRAKRDLEKTIETIVKDEEETLIDYINSQNGWRVFVCSFDLCKHYEGEEIWVGSNIWVLSYNGKRPSNKDIKQLNKLLLSSSYTTYLIYKYIKSPSNEKENNN